MPDNNNLDGNVRRSRTRSAQAGRKNPRLRLACLRCQRRKIKCDGELPTCKNCRNAGAACTDGESARLKDLPREYISTLKSRISWLESIVRSRCPDVDLTQDTPVDVHEALDTTILEDTTSSILQSPAPMQTNIETLSDTIHEASNAETPNHPVRSAPGPTGAGAITHEIGLVSLGTNQDPRYIGPSSGYFLARVMLDSASKQDERLGRASRNSPFPTKLVEAIQGPLPLPPRDMATQLCNAYFSAINLQHPILHQHTFNSMLNQAYEQDTQDPVVSFQIFMVLAIGSAVLSGRIRARIPAESYCLSALQYLDELNLENSLQGVQCLLLLLVFTIHSPFVRLNVWYLNYHCIAALLDLGLQRNISAGAGISLLEQEMRARIFWVIYSFDRVIATMMGRPIGIRDEGCELRMPIGLSDEQLASPHQQQTAETSGEMAFAIHLFKAAKLNSEIKYIAQSITRDSPRYAYPRVVDINEWQTNMLGQLDEWASQISGLNKPSELYLRTTCLIRHHGLRMLLLRPSPAIPKPSNEALVQCHKSARESIQLFDQLYKKDLLVHSWTTFHGLVLSTITLLYCIKVVPEITRSTEVDVLMADLSISLSVLSATGEHWSGAKRSRDILDELGKSTIRYLRENNNRQDGPVSRSISRVNGMGFDPTTLSTEVLESSGMTDNHVDTSLIDANDSMGFMQNSFDDGLFGDSFAGYFEQTDSINVDNIVRELFQDFIPTYPNGL
ncbi:related to purine utilization positive regulator [Fusarium torulosum]|uniref:Related to purine utilization positive regulator n=1 Tax=Fusarium torulosum TaxID=33205 RepID=A0AAE8MCC0_9HYPO|nr:related to purine utilization positive regulator [Fusarium torulosum]